MIKTYSKEGEQTKFEIIFEGECLDVETLEMVNISTLAFEDYQGYSIVIRNKNLNEIGDKSIEDVMRESIGLINFKTIEDLNNVIDELSDLKKVWENNLNDKSK